MRACRPKNFIIDCAHAGCINVSFFCSCSHSLTSRIIRNHTLNAFVAAVPIDFFMFWRSCRVSLSWKYLVLFICSPIIFNISFLRTGILLSGSLLCTYLHRLFNIEIEYDHIAFMTRDGQSVRYSYTSVLLSWRF